MFGFAKQNKKLSAGTDNGSDGAIKPQLTSLIDVMTILLVFLLKSFSVEGDLVRPSEDLALPESRSIQRPKPALNVEITTSGINVDGQPVAPLSSAADTDSMLVPELDTWLRGLLQLTGNGDKEHEVNIQCDKTMDFKIVKKVMFTCARSHYSIFSLLVMEKE